MRVIYYIWLNFNLSIVFLGEYIWIGCFVLRISLYRSCRSEAFWEKGVLRNFAKFAVKHLCQSLFFNKVPAWNFIKKETLAQVFSCEFCKISKNTFSYRTPPVAASGYTFGLNSKTRYTNTLMTSHFCVIFSHIPPLNKYQILFL